MGRWVLTAEECPSISQRISSKGGLVQALLVQRTLPSRHSLSEQMTPAVKRVPVLLQVMWVL